MGSDLEITKKNLEDDHRDVADLWNDALKNYRNIVQVDLDKLPVPKFTETGDMINYWHEQMEGFQNYRYNKGKGDKLRGLLKASIWYIQKGTEQLAAAATPAFPPAGVIGMAFSYMLSACNKVSADYDVVSAFFEDMNSFLQRVTILESRLPRYRAYQNCLMDVFTSLLEMCGFATRYIREGRFKKWTSSLIKGEDSKLSGARQKMDKSIDTLRSATEFAILGNTEEIKKMNRELLENQEAQTKMSETLLEKQDQTLALVASLPMILKALENRKDGERSKPKPAEIKKGEAATAARVRSFFPTTTNPMVEYNEIKESFVEGTCTWLFEQASWKNWCKEKTGFLSISGPRGSGKSSLAAAAYDELVKTSKENTENHTIVACFYFRQTNKDLISFQNAVNWIIVQIAEYDTKLCEKILAEYAREDNEFNVNYWLESLESLIAPLFEQASTSRLQLVLDGVDELDLAQRKLLLQCMKEIKTKGLNISVVYTTRPSILLEFQETNSSSIVVDKELNLPDFQALISNRLSSFDKLRKFSLVAQQKIATRLEEAADGILYVEHMLRRYNSIGRESTVLKDMQKNMPANLNELYDLMLSDCVRRTPTAHKEILRILFVWLAYSMWPLTLKQLLFLQSLITDDDSFSLDEEIEGMFSRILHLAETTTSAKGEMNVDPAKLLSDLNDADNSESLPDDYNFPVRFQERSIREFFRDPDTPKYDLKTPCYTAHALIFITCAKILLDDIPDRSRPVDQGIRTYAARCWDSHFYKIDASQLTQEDYYSVLESIAAVMMGNDNVSATFEELILDQTIFASESEKGDFEKRISEWASNGSKADQSKLTQNTSNWIQSVTENPKNIWTPLAKSHIRRLYGAKDADSALDSFSHAFEVMQKVDPARYDSEDEPMFSEKHIDMLKNEFSDIQIDSQAHWSFSSLLLFCGKYEPAATEAKAGLLQCNDDIGRFRNLNLLAIIQTEMKAYEEAYKSINEALGISSSFPVPPNLLAKGLLNCAKIELSLQKFDEAAKSYERARIAWSQEDPTDILPGDYLKETIQVFEGKKDYVGLINTLKNWSSFERMTWLTWQYWRDNTIHETFRKAASKASQQDFMVKTYEEVIHTLDRLESGAPVRYELAIAQKEVRNDLEAAKILLNEVLDSSLNVEVYAFTEAYPGEVLYNTMCTLSDIIYEQFQCSSDRQRKTTLLNEIKELPNRNLGHSIVIQNSLNIHHTVLVAKMLQKMGPLQEYHDTLDRAFNLCFNALTDGVGWNDLHSLYALATILGSVSGLEKEAQIAVSALFSDLDADVDDETPNTGFRSLHCDGECEPKKVFNSWGKGALYLCMNCSDILLCEECYLKRQSYNRGEEINNWRPYCGEHHPYIKGPFNGWKGITHGAITIEGEIPVKFKDWLVELKELKWKDVWERFWRDDGKAVDII